jgi:hypothetical protein
MPAFWQKCRRNVGTLRDRQGKNTDDAKGRDKASAAKVVEFAILGTPGRPWAQRYLRPLLFNERSLRT